MIQMKTSDFNLTHLNLIHQDLTKLNCYYPNISDWFINTIIPDVIDNNGTSKLIIAHENNNMIGFALGKKTDIETKLRCIRVSTEYRYSGVGIKLVDSMINELQCTKPYVTVSEEMLHLYSRMFVNRYGFKLDEVLNGAYRENKLEYYFNK